MTCSGLIPNTFIVCGEGENFCSELCMLRAAVAPFAAAARAHGLKPPKGDDLWCSLGVAHSAWWRAMEVTK